MAAFYVNRFKPQVRNQLSFSFEKLRQKDLDYGVGCVYALGYNTGGKVTFNSTQIVDGVVAIVGSFGVEINKRGMFQCMEEINDKVQQIDINLVHPHVNLFPLQQQLEQLLERYNGMYIELQNINKAYQIIREEVLRQIRIKKKTSIHECCYPSDCFEVRISLNYDEAADEMALYLASAVMNQEFDICFARDAFSIDVYFNSKFYYFEKEQENNTNEEESRIGEQSSWQRRSSGLPTRDDGDDDDDDSLRLLLKLLKRLQ
eukprot:TRINITY_DN8252_c0_g5_i2.p1 TRINITY_DN8252_c0_g5~~TRINITY_DN8252_c0_g5_i2.p1  ORF type:complete len:276 (+),score=29.22 TRINITY_DN8252_c0_g5_i2:49-828(+)